MPSFFCWPVKVTVRVQEPSAWSAVVTRARAQPLNKIAAANVIETPNSRMELSYREARARAALARLWET